MLIERTKSGLSELRTKDSRGGGKLAFVHMHITNQHTEGKNRHIPLIIALPLAPLGVDLHVSLREKEEGRAVLFADVNCLSITHPSRSR